MRRVLTLVIVASCAGLLPTAATSAMPRSGPPFSQQVELRNDRGPFAVKYSAFPDNVANGCTSCSAPLPISSGKVSVKPQTYVLIEQNKKYDYYLVQANITVSGQKGTRSSGVLTTTLKSLGASSYSTFSAGYVQTSQNCHTYPIDLGASWGGVDASTTVAHYSTCVKTTVSHHRVKNGDVFSVTNLNGIKSIAFSRFVRVKAKTHPKFRVTVTLPRARCHSEIIPTTGTVLDCDPGSTQKSWKIGTTGS
jgi:hypothetical protein